jgi:hypothetical protein
METNDLKVIENIAIIGYNEKPCNYNNYLINIGF